MNSFIVLPVVVPLTLAALALLCRTSFTLQRLLGLCGSIGTVMTSIGITRSVIHHGTQFTQLGNWPAPFGITLVADHFSTAFLLVAAVLGISIMIYSFSEVSPLLSEFGFYPLLLVLFAGVNGALLTGDIFNLYVWFEVILIASFALLTLGNRPDQIKGGIFYVIMNLIASALFLSAVGTLYGVTGSLNLADLANHFRENSQLGKSSSIPILFLCAFGIKAALFPLFFWLPESYHTPPVTVSAIFAGLLTKIGIYALVRVFTLLFIPGADKLKLILLITAALTMITGVLGATAQNEFRRILSFHIISQIGYMIMGLGFASPLALAGTLFFVIHNMIVKSNLFLISGIVYQLQGSFELSQLGGLYRSNLFLSVLFLISAFSLAGLPPLSGFWGKLLLAKAGFEIGQNALVAVSLFVGLLTLYSMTKIWIQAFWMPPPSRLVSTNSVRTNNLKMCGLMLPAVGLTSLTLIIGLYPEHLIAFVYKAGTELTDPRAYIRTVLHKEVIQKPPQQGRDP